VRPLSKEKKAALRAIRDEGLLDNGQWIHSLMVMVIEHVNPVHMAEALILFNRVWGFQIPYISQNSLEGRFIKRVMMQFIASESPLEQLITVVSSTSRLALEQASILGYLSDNPWSMRITLLLLSHSNALDILDGINSVNQFFQGQLLTISPKSSAGNLINKIFAKFLEEKYTPLEITQFLGGPDKIISLKEARQNHLFAEGEWTPSLVMMILKHRNPRELTSAFILLNRILFGRLAEMAAHEREGRFFRIFSTYLGHKEHPFIKVAAFSKIFRLFRYRYTFSIATEGASVLPFHIYFHKGKDGFLNYSLVTKDEEVYLNQVLSIMAPELLTLESLEAMKEQILAEIDGSGLIDYYDEEWFNFFMKSFLNHPTPYSFSLMLSKFNDLNFWENHDYIHFIKIIHDFSSMWIVHPEFLYLFMQLPQKSMNVEFLSFITEKTRLIDFSAPMSVILEQLNVICEQFKRVLDCQVQGVPLNPYINLLFQKKDFIHSFPEAQTELFDFTQYSMEDYFESSILKTVSP
jgi:hypothetical protein